MRKDPHHRGRNTEVSRLEVRHCAWCPGEIRPAARRDAITCSKACRQARHRFRVGAAGATAGEPARFAYADPPYPGMAQKYYGTEEVNHVELVARLVAEYPAGWALLTSASTLQEVLAMCPAGVRVACWVKGPRPGVSWRPRSAWEPLIVAGGRPRRLGVEEYSSDVLIWGGRQHSHPGALIGMKSAAYAEWVFRQLGALAGDTLDDLFPGSGIIGRAWQIYSRAVPRGIRDTSQGSPGDDSRPASTNDGSSRDTSCLAGAERQLRERTKG